ncbi:MAG TPA: hypothetical protein PLH94_08280 [Fimbriimonadaceae bacterium]|nr:hypothetical protein [Fimbriimonadaceae bacterium]
MIGLLAVTTLVGAADRTAILDHAFAVWAGTPAMRIEDAYKWLFHATLGGEHAVRDDAGPRAWMEREWSSLGPPKRGEPLVVALTPDRRLLRVQLRPYRALGGDRDMLLALFVSSAERFRGDRRAFRATWDALGDRLARRPWHHLTSRAWKHLDRKVRSVGFPAIDHSPAYLQRYDPAYRVIDGSLWTGLGAGSP